MTKLDYLIDYGVLSALIVFEALTLAVVDYYDTREKEKYEQSATIQFQVNDINKGSSLDTLIIEGNEFQIKKLNEKFILRSK